MSVRSFLQMSLLTSVVPGVPPPLPPPSSVPTSSSNSSSSSSNLVTFASSSSFSARLATEKAKCANAVHTFLLSDLASARRKSVRPTFKDLYPSGKFQLTYYNGRRLDQDDMRADNARIEAAMSSKLALEEAKQDKWDAAYKGSSQKTVFKDVGGGTFTSHFARPPGRDELDRRICQKQAGLWTEEWPTGEMTRVEKVVAKKWGIDADATYWSDTGLRKEKFRCTFFNGRKYDREDLQQQDKKAEGDRKRDLLQLDADRRKKECDGLLPSERERLASESKYQGLPHFAVNFPTVDKKAGMGTGQLITLLDALDETELQAKKFVLPVPSDFVCVPKRPGARQVFEKQARTINLNRIKYIERKEAEGAAKKAATSAAGNNNGRGNNNGEEDDDEERFFGDDDDDGSSGGGGGSPGVKRYGHALDQSSVLSAKTSVTVMRSEVSVGANPAENPWRKDR